MTLLDVYKRFNHAHDTIVCAIESYVKEHGGFIECRKSRHMRFMDSRDGETYTVYKFDHIYMSNGDCIVSYTEDTEIELKLLTCDELNDLISDIIDRSKKENDWSRYINYLHEWADSHKLPSDKGMTPASFDEWYDNEREVCE